MQENQKYNDSAYFFGTLIKYWKFIVIFTILGAITSAIIAYNLTIWYSATVNLVPSSSGQDASASGGSTISSALKEFGLTNMSGKNEGSTYSYIVILQSRTVIDSLINKYNLSEEYDIPKNESKTLRKAFESNVEIALEKEGNYTITVWDQDKNKAAEIANDYVKIANSHFLEIFRQDNLLSRNYFNKRIVVLDSTIAALGNQLKLFSKKTLLFAPEQQAEQIAKSISDIKSEQMKYDILSDYFTNNYGADDPFAMQNKKLADQFKDKLSNIQNQPGFAGNFSISNATDVQVDYLKIYTEFETYSKVKAFLLPTIEKIRSEEVRNIQNLIVVDSAIVPDSKDKPRRGFIMAGSTFGSFIISILLVFAFNYIKELRKKIKELKKSEN
ncbi:MAG: hypothetical protein A2X64_06640 [Ignavibacteria bacterium GWF2_33_9]|nr:MAG: hypothetical protein A2X64_06640 [Ignavibacteria bacterium GWF2_33_9]